MNCTFKKTFDYDPEGLTSGLDMITGKRMLAPVKLPPQSTVVFYAPVKAASVP